MSGAGAGGPIEAVVVAIPAHDEQEWLPQCLRSVNRAVQELAQRRPEVETLVVVAADGCTDDTARLARAYGALTREISVCKVGPARDAAIEHGLSRLDTPAARTWIADTDADTTVPERWLTQQVELAEGGVDVLVGTVEPDDAANSQVLAEWRRRHELRDGHSHVHAANLGLRASGWRTVGGFGDRAVHEDVHLLERARSAGLRVLATDRTRVRTSARVTNRVPGGFGGYLQELAQDVLDPTSRR